MVPRTGTGYRVKIGDLFHQVEPTARAVRKGLGFIRHVLGVAAAQERPMASRSARVLWAVSSMISRSGSAVIVLIGRIRTDRLTTRGDDGAAPRRHGRLPAGTTSISPLPHDTRAFGILDRGLLARLILGPDITAIDS